MDSGYLRKKLSNLFGPWSDEVTKQTKLQNIELYNLLSLYRLGSLNQKGDDGWLCGMHGDYAKCISDFFIRIFKVRTCMKDAWNIIHSSKTLVTTNKNIMDSTS